MSDYRVQTQTFELAGSTWHIRSLLDGNQFSDPDGVAAACGISEESWGHFGRIWPAGQVLAEVVGLPGSFATPSRLPTLPPSPGSASADTRPAVGETRAFGTYGRMLEIGCGLALAGLVAHRAGVDITVSDLHPLTEDFLLHNLALNDLPPLAFRTVDWSLTQPALGRFDTIIGSDILYEPQQAAQLAGFVERHASEGAEIIVVDPGRGHRGRFTRLLAEQGFACVVTRPEATTRTQVLRYRRP